MDKTADELLDLAEASLAKADEYYAKAKEYTKEATLIRKQEQENNDSND